MGPGASLLLYLLIGAGVGVAVGLMGGEQRLFRVACAVVFWPFFVPGLLSGTPPPVEPIPEPAPADADDLTPVIAQADADLRAALEALEGWAGQVPMREKEREVLDRTRRLRGMMWDHGHDGLGVGVPTVAASDATH